MATPYTPARGDWAGHIERFRTIGSKVRESSVEEVRVELEAEECRAGRSVHVVCETGTEFLGMPPRWFYSKPHLIEHKMAEYGWTFEDLDRRNIDFDEIDGVGSAYGRMHIWRWRDVCYRCIVHNSEFFKGGIGARHYALWNRQEFDQSLAMAGDPAGHLQRVAEVYADSCRVIQRELDGAVARDEPAAPPPPSIPALSDPEKAILNSLRLLREGEGLNAQELYQAVEDQDVAITSAQSIRDFMTSDKPLKKYCGVRSRTGVGYYLDRAITPLSILESRYAI